MTKKLAVAAFAFSCLGAQGAGIQAEHVVTEIERDHERVEVGQWTQDEVGRSRFDIDEWTQITDPVERVTYRANSKRGRYSKARFARPSPPMGSPLIDLPGSLSSPNSHEVSRTDLGTQVINGVECKGTRAVIIVSGGGFRKEIEFEAWMTEAFVFPFNVKFVTRSDGSEHITELRNIVELTDSELEGVFRPPEDWKESRFALTRTNVAWSGIWPFTRPGKKVTGTVWPWPRSEKQDW